MSIGIGAIHCVLPADRIPVRELPEFGSLSRRETEFAETSGVAEIGEFRDSTATDLAVRACQELAAAGRLDPDVLLQVGQRAPDVLLGSDAGRIQKESGLSGSFAFTVDGLGCAGSSAAWALARDLLVADPSRRSVLITHGSRPTGVDRIRYPVTVIGDGAYAMTIERDVRPVLRAHRMQTDGDFHDLFKVDYKQTPWYEWREECSSPDRYSFELALQSRLRLGKLVTQVLADARVGKDQVAATVMQNVTATAYDFYESLLELPIHPVCRGHLREYGHLGAMDVVLNLDRLLSSGELRTGDLVLVLNNSPVAAWAVTLWEV